MKRVACYNDITVNFFPIAMHIQCSNATYQLLCKLGGFELESRGIIEVKVCTYMYSVTILVLKIPTK